MWEAIKQISILLKLLKTIAKKIRIIAFKIKNITNFESYKKSVNKIKC